MNLNRPKPLSLPPVEALPPAVAKIVHEHTKLLAQEGAAASALLRLEESRRAAVDQDRHAYSRAIRAGKPDPGQPATAKVDADMADARRLIEACRQALADLQPEITAAIDVARPSWTARLAKQRATAHDRYQQAVNELDAARTELVTLRVLADWLRNPEAHRIWKVGSPPVVLLRSQNGDPQSWGSVVSALQGEFPAVPATPDRAVPPAQLLANIDQQTRAFGPDYTEQSYGRP